MSIDSRKLMEAVRQLREQAGLTQTAFAQKLGKTLSTIQRYEGQVPPSGEALAPLVNLAFRQGRDDLAELFREALLDSLGGEFIEALGAGPRVAGADELYKTGRIHALLALVTKTQELARKALDEAARTSERLQPLTDDWLYVESLVNLFSSSEPEAEAAKKKVFRLLEPWKPTSILEP